MIQSPLRHNSVNEQSLSWMNKVGAISRKLHHHHHHRASDMIDAYFTFQSTMKAKKRPAAACMILGTRQDYDILFYSHWKSSWLPSTTNTNPIIIRFYADYLYFYNTTLIQLAENALQPYPMRSYHIRCSFIHIRRCTGCLIYIRKISQPNLLAPLWPQKDHHP